MGGGGGSAKIGDGGGDFVLFKEESMGEIAGGKMGTTKEGKKSKIFLQYLGKRSKDSNPSKVRILK